MPSSSTAEATRNPLDRVESEIGFISRQPGPEGPFAPHKVTVRNARPKLNEFSLDREGFTLVPQKMSCLDEKDPTVLREKYVAEMTAFLADYFKTSWIEPFESPLVIRESLKPITRGLDDTDEDGVKATAGVAHLDFSPIAGPMLAAQQSQRHGIPIRAYSRLMIINTWRPITPPPQDFPLALCDSTSVRKEDIFPMVFTEQDGLGRVWENGGGYYSENERWWYFPDMTPDELILFKGYDSKQDFNVIHGAFDNRAASPNAGIRRSIEYRFFVYYE